MIRLGKVPDCLKTRLISPVFKNKGSNKESKNYRGITVTPVLSKILELLLVKSYARLQIRFRVIYREALQKGHHV